MTEARENNFNLIRLVLATSVILAHSPEIIDGDRRRELVAVIFGVWISLGDLAVDGFFTLSGYLIAQSWTSDPRLSRFFRKRVLRIVPGFLAACLLSGLVLAPLGTEAHYWEHFLPRRFIKGMVTLAGPLVPDAFPGYKYPVIDGPVWTIQYEFACYVSLAVVGLLGLLGRRGLVLVCAVALTVWAAAQAAVLVPPIPARFFLKDEDKEIPRLFSCFFAGTTFYAFRDRLDFKRWWVLASGLLLILALRSPIMGTIAIPWLGGYLLLACAFAGVAPRTNWVRAHDLSYGIYLYAWPIQMFLLVRAHVMNPWLLTAITIPLAMLAGWISWRLVEKPALRLKG